MGKECKHKFGKWVYSHRLMSDQEKCGYDRYCQKCGMWEFSIMKEDAYAK